MPDRPPVLLRCQDSVSQFPAQAEESLGNKDTRSICHCAGALVEPHLRQRHRVGLRLSGTEWNDYACVDHDAEITPLAHGPTLPQIALRVPVLHCRPQESVACPVLVPELPGVKMR